MNDFIYTEILSIVIKSLYTEVLSIGMFLVGFGYVRSVMMDPKIIRKEFFWRRIILLFSVMLFTIYIILPYNIDSILKDKINANITSSLSPKIFLLFIEPLELLMVGVSGSMFLILGYDIFPLRKTITKTHLKSPPQSKLPLTFLFVASAILHFCCIIWWFFWIGHPRFSIASVYIHAIITLVHLISFFIWRSISSSRRYSTHNIIFDWIGVLWYFLFICIVYIIRMNWYAETVINSCK